MYGAWDLIRNTRIVYMPKLSLNNLTAISVIYMSLKL